MKSFRWSDTIKKLLKLIVFINNQFQGDTVAIDIIK